MAEAKATRAASERFLLTYRLEIADGVGEGETWRGWIARVPSAAEPIAVSQPQMRWFLSLDALPDLIRELLKDSPTFASSRRANQQGRAEP